MNENQKNIIKKLSRFSKYQIIFGVLYIILALILFSYFIISRSYFFSIIFLFCGLAFSYFIYMKYMGYNSINKVNEEIEYIYKLSKDRNRTMPWILRIGELIFLVMLIYGLWMSKFDIPIYAYIIIILLIASLISILEIILKEQRIAINLGKIYIFETGIYILGYKYIEWNEINNLEKRKDYKNNRVINIKINKRNILLEIDDRTLNLIKNKIKNTKNN